LFFSEYIEGSGNNKGVEIYNPTDQPIELNNYYVVRYSNGSSVFTEGGITQLEGTILPYTTHVLVNGQTESSGTSPACDPAMQALADQLDHDYPAPTYMNGNDAMALLKTTNGIPPSATNPGTPVDLIGQIGLGSAISSETGWSYVQDSTLTYNNSNGDPVTGKVINYIVQKNATNGSDYGPFWMSWTSNHSLIRKPDVVEGVLTNPSPFIVYMQWDTLPAQLDTVTGFYSYTDIWDNLGFHVCDASSSPIAINDQAETGIEQLLTISVLDNDIFQTPVVLSIEQYATQGDSYIPSEDQNVINFLPDSGFVGIDSITYKIANTAIPTSFSTAKVYISVIEGAGIEELSGQFSMVIYPNPIVSDYFIIISDNKIKSAQVFDIMGKEIISDSFASPQKEAIVEIGQNHKGIYMVKVTFMNNSSTVQKILVR
jgi:hypothetical protein